MSNIKGFDQLIKKLNKIGKADFVKAEIAGAAFDIEANAKNNASAIQGIPPEIKQMISQRITNDGLTAVISQNALPMGAYIEFGTGIYVKVAPEWKDMAWQFYKNGKGRLHASPYMYPAFVEGRERLISNLKAKLKELIK